MSNKMKVFALGAAVLMSGTAFAGEASGDFNTGDNLVTNIDLSVDFDVQATLTLAALTASNAGATSTDDTLTISGQSIPTADLFGTSAESFDNVSVSNAGYARKNTGESGSPAMYAVGASATITGAFGVDKFDLQVEPPADPESGKVLSAAEIRDVDEPLPSDEGFEAGGSTELGVPIGTNGEGARNVFVGFHILNTFDSSGTPSGVFLVSAVAD